MADLERTLQHDAARIIRELFGREIRLTETIRRGLMTFKYLVETGDSERFIVRFYPPGRENVVNCEPDLLARCRRAGLPVPLVVADARTGPPANLPYVAYRATDGVTLSEKLAELDAVQQRALAVEVARCLFELKHVEFEGYGELITGDAADCASWRVFVNRSFNAGLESLAQHRLVGPQLMRRLNALVPRVRLVEDWLPRQLVWGDVGFGNILVSSSGRFVGLIDFESCLSGDSIATLGYCFSAHGDQPMCAALLGAWPEALDAAAQERVFLYAILRCLRLAPYAHLPLPTGHARDSLRQIFPGVEIALEELTDRR